MDGVNKVKKAKLLLNDEKCYHVGEVLENFENYFRNSLEELFNLFSNYQIIEKEKIKNYIISHQDDMWENRFHKSLGIKENVENIIAERMSDYNLYYQRLAILAHKGQNYLSLLKYVANEKDVFHEDEFYELIFSYLHISHYGKIMTGKHLKKILIPLSYITLEMQIILNQINNLKNYNRQNWDAFARSQGEFEFHAIDNISYDDDSYMIDKTAFYCPKRRNLKIKK